MPSKHYATPHNSVSLVPFALMADGQLADISAFNSGLVTGAVCPECKSALVARKGVSRVHHFAHYSKSDCAGGLETSLHIAAKQVLENAARKNLSFYAPEYANLVGETIHRYPSLDFPLKQVQCEVTVSVPGEHRRPDALAVWEPGKIAIEICVTNPMSEDRVYFYECAGLDCIEIDLGSVAKKFAKGSALSLSDIAHAVLRDPQTRTWKCRSEWIYAMLKNDGALGAIPHYGKYSIGSKSASNA